MYRPDLRFRRIIMGKTGAYFKYMTADLGNVEFEASGPWHCGKVDTTSSFDATGVSSDPHHMTFYRRFIWHLFWHMFWPLPVRSLSLCTRCQRAGMEICQMHAAAELQTARGIYRELDGDIMGITNIHQPELFGCFWNGSYMINVHTSYPPNCHQIVDAEAPGPRCGDSPVEVLREIGQEREEGTFESSALAVFFVSFEAPQITRTWKCKGFLEGFPTRNHRNSSWPRSWTFSSSNSKLFTAGIPVAAHRYFEDKHGPT